MANEKGGQQCPSYRLQPPRFPQRFGAHAIGFVVVDELVLLVVVLDGASQVERDVGSVARDVRVLRGLGVSLR